MNIFFWNKKKFRIGEVEFENKNNIHIIELSGNRIKIKKDRLISIKIEKLPTDFEKKINDLSAKITVKEVWKAAPKNDFSIRELSEIIFPKILNSIAEAATLKCVVENPIYFRRKKYEFFYSVESKIIEAALKRESIKRKKIEEEDLLAKEIIRGNVPEKIKKMGIRLLHDVDKASLEYRALKKACKYMKAESEELLIKIGVFKSAFEIHKLFFCHKFIKSFKKDFDYSNENLKKGLIKYVLVTNSNVEAYSIDHTSAKEIDDALSVIREEIEFDGKKLETWKVGVHIALPVAFLSPADCEEIGINHRGLSIYTPSETIMMMPEEILKKASLVENSYKPVISLYVNFNESSQLLKHNTVVENIFIKKNLSFGKWEENFLKSRDPSSLPWIGLKTLFSIANCLKNERLKTTKELESKLESKVFVKNRLSESFKDMNCNGVPFIEKRDRGTISDVIVSEFMILTNSIWATQLAKMTEPGIFRVNSMGQTKMQIKPSPHEGLCKNFYAWTTSPLRRYVDFLNQWQIVCSILKKNLTAFKNKQELSNEIRNFERKQFAYGAFEKIMKKYWILRYLINKKNESGEFWKKKGNDRFILEAKFLGANKYSLCETLLVIKHDTLKKYDVGQLVLLEVLSINCLKLEIKFI